VDHLDLVDRLVPCPAQTLVVETPAGELVLVDTKRPPAQGDTVFAEDAFRPYEVGLDVSGVAYCTIRFH